MVSVGMVERRQVRINFSANMEMDWGFLIRNALLGNKTMYLMAVGFLTQALVHVCWQNSAEVCVSVCCCFRFGLLGFLVLVWA